MTDTSSSKGFARLGIVAALFLITLLVSPPKLHAIAFNLMSDHCSGAGGCGTPPFGTVTLTQNGTTVDVTVHLNSPNQFVKTAAADFMAFKFNPTVVLTAITVDQTVPGQTLVAAMGAFNGDGTGPFAFGIACASCANGASNAFSNDIVFHVANATIADVSRTNVSGSIFVADIMGSTGNTGPVSSDIVPEPASILLLGIGFVGVGVAMRRRQRQA